MAKYVIGADFGTLSVRALVAQLGTGRELASCAVDYPSGVLTQALPNGRPLKRGSALQDPRDYLPCLSRAVRGAVDKAGVSKDDILAIGIDATSSTFFPADRDLVPLICRPEYENEPAAWAKMWKHHGAQAEADEMTASPLSAFLLPRYGGKLSVEWMMPKLLETLREAREMYREATYFVEVGDYIVSSLTGEFTAAEPMSGFKAFRDKDAGFPDRAYFASFDPEFAGITEKLAARYLPLGTCAGTLTRKMAEQLGLTPGIPVAPANIDAHVSLPASGVTCSGEMHMIMGTSICHLLNFDKSYDVPGICGRVRDGVIPSLYGYEAGQSGGGDHYDWATRVLKADGNAHATLTREAASLAPGSGGLIALDWWNGNRSILTNSDLSGLMLGMTLDTRPCQIYRALIEATAYGTRRIIDNYAEHGVKVDALSACGGIAVKNPLVMQIFADVTGRAITLARSHETVALGSAMWGAVALGSAKGGYDNIRDCAAEMGGKLPGEVAPDPARARVYDELYEKYRYLHDLFGRETDIMKQLKKY